YFRKTPIPTLPPSCVDPPTSQPNLELPLGFPTFSILPATSRPRLIPSFAWFGYLPTRLTRAARLTAEALTFTNTSSLFGLGFSTSTNCICSVPPGSLTKTAFIYKYLLINLLLL